MRLSSSRQEAGGATIRAACSSSLRHRTAACTCRPQSACKQHQADRVKRLLPAPLLRVISPKSQPPDGPLKGCHRHACRRTWHKRCVALRSMHSVRKRARVVVAVPCTPEGPAARQGRPCSRAGRPAATRALPPQPHNGASQDNTSTAAVVIAEMPAAAPLRFPTCQCSVEYK